MSSSRTAQVAIATVLLLASACGKSAHSGMNMTDSTSKASATRTVDVDMVDVGFRPAELTAHMGDTVRFVFHNRGKVKHEALFGDAAVQDAHEKEMGAMGASGHSMMTNEVDPGSSRTINYTFDKLGTTLIGCHETGHYAAGMKITVTVS
jgi:uncharacterized cupredoxin-like copper-binding protein